MPLSNSDKVNERGARSRQGGRRMNRRGFLQALGVGATHAQADRIRIRPEVRVGEPTGGGDRTLPGTVSARSLDAIYRPGN